MESISIKNFGGIKKLEIELNRVNIFTGAQASGKSLTAKLIYYFKRVIQEYLDGLLNEKPRGEIDKRLLMKFESYFPADTWPPKGFEIVYKIGIHQIVIKKGRIYPKIIYSEAIIKSFDHCERLIRKDKKDIKSREEYELYKMDLYLQGRYLHILGKELGVSMNYTPLFVPAGRSFFAHFQEWIFSILSTSKAIDPFLIEFGSYYESVKIIERRTQPDNMTRQLSAIVSDLFLDVIGGKYYREENKDYLIHADERKINVAFASSGQQEALPLVLILKSLLTRANFLNDETSLFIEEPEAHLFPAAQRRMVELIGLVFNNARSRTQFIITTHSPYILTVLNNLVQASLIYKSGSDRVKRKIDKILPKEMMIDGEALSAFAFKDGSAESIIDKETGLIQASYLDKVSEDIAIQFDSLLNVL